MAKVFISYKHDVQPDVRLAAGIADVLRGQGHSVFIDSQIPVGQEWPVVIEQELGNAEYLVILVSEAAASSEVIVKEVAIAHQLRKKHGAPRLLPVRVAYEAALPYDLGGGSIASSMRSGATIGTIKGPTPRSWLPSPRRPPKRPPGMPVLPMSWLPMGTRCRRAAPFPRRCPLSIPDGSKCWRTPPAPCA